MYKIACGKCGTEKKIPDSAFEEKISYYCEKCGSLLFARNDSQNRNVIIDVDKMAEEPKESSHTFMWAFMYTFTIILGLVAGPVLGIPLCVGGFILGLNYGPNPHALVFGGLLTANILRLFA